MATRRTQTSLIPDINSIVPAVGIPKADLTGMFSALGKSAIGVGGASAGFLKGFEKGYDVEEDEENDEETHECHCNGKVEKIPKGEQCPPCPKIDEGDPTGDNVDKESAERENRQHEQSSWGKGSPNQFRQRRSKIYGKRRKRI